MRHSLRRTFDDCQCFAVQPVQEPLHRVADRAAPATRTRMGTLSVHCWLRPTHLNPHSTNQLPNLDLCAQKDVGPFVQPLQPCSVSIAIHSLHTSGYSSFGRIEASASCWMEVKRRRLRRCIRRSSVFALVRAREVAISLTEQTQVDCRSRVAWSAESSDTRARGGQA